MLTIDQRMVASVYVALRPALVYSRLVGIYPQSRKSGHRAAFFLYLCMYSTSVLISSVASLLWLQNKDPEWYESVVHLLVAKSQTVVVSFSYLAALATALCHYRVLRKILRGVHQSDRALSRHSDSGNFYLFAVICFRGAAQLCLLLLDFYLNWGSKFRYVLFELVATHLPLFAVSALQLQEFALLQYIGAHFVAMTSEVEAAGPLARVDRIVCLLRVYDCLKQLALEVNDCFFFNTIFSLISIFLYIIVTLHLVATSGIVRSNLSPTLYVYCLGFVLLKLYELWNIIQPFAHITEEVSKFNGSIFKLMVNDKTRHLAGNEKLQLHIATKQELSFTARGFFNLDYSLIHSMLGAIATFLVILIQFDIISDPTI